MVDPKGRLSENFFTQQPILFLLLLLIRKFRQLFILRLASAAFHFQISNCPISYFHYLFISSSTLYSMNYLLFLVSPTIFHGLIGRISWIKS